MNKRILVLLVVSLFLYAGIGSALAQKSIDKVPIQKTPVLKPRLTVKEECFSFNPASTIVMTKGGNWVVVDKTKPDLVIASFPQDKKADADRTLDIIKKYGMNQICSVKPGFQYELVSGQPPTGSYTEEDCRVFNPEKISAANIKGRWKIIEGNNILFDFGSNEAQARLVLGVIKNHGFTRSCTVGKPIPGFHYMAKQTITQITKPTVQPPPITVTPKLDKPTPPKPITPDVEEIKKPIPSRILPDLIVEDIYSDKPLIMGEEAIIKIRIRNVGKMDAQSPSEKSPIRTRVSYSEPPYHVDFRLDSLKKGDPKTFEVKLAAVIKEKEKIRATVDTGNAILESNENNNTREKEFTYSVRSQTVGGLSFPPITHDFTRDRFNCGLEHKKGYVDVCAILWDPRRPGHPAPGRDDIHRLLFGPVPYDPKSKNLSAWFLENSSRKLVIQPRAVCGWYNADKPPGWYWRLSGVEVSQARIQGVGLGKGETDEEGFIDGHKRKWWEAIRNASKEFNFAEYDKNPKDGKVTRDELVILIVIPQSYSEGYCCRDVIRRERPKEEPLVIQGVEIAKITEWYTGNPPNFGVAAHELCHLLLNADDISTATIPHWPFRAGVYSVMDTPFDGSVHLDPFHKLKVGWLSPRPISVTGTYTLKDVETSGEVLILCDPRRGYDEYFIVENRWRGSSHDAGAPPNGNGIPADGVAIWHIVEDQTLYKKTGAMRLAQGSAWGTQCIRLIRADGGIALPGNPPNDSRALFTRKYGTIASPPRTSYFSWLDRTPVPFELKILTNPGPEIRISIEIK